ncbi:MAG: DUF63 family protein [Halobacteriales archaeon]
MALPEGFALPPLAHLAALLVSVLAVGGLLLRRRPRVTGDVVLALAPWMVVGSALHALFQLGAVPSAVAPLLGTPAVYLTTFVVAGVAWLTALSVAPDRGPRVLAGAGAAAFLVAVIPVFASADAVHPWLSLGGVVAAAALTGACWLVLARVVPGTAVTTGGVGALVLFAHALDGVSTAIGADLLAFTERTPLSAAILEFAGSLPTADPFGSGWLFVLVKLALAAGIVHLFADYVREEPEQAYLLLAFVVAVGLGPGAQNVLLFAVR